MAQRVLEGLPTRAKLAIAERLRAILSWLTFTFPGFPIQGMAAFSRPKFPGPCAHLHSHRAACARLVHS